MNSTCSITAITRCASNKSLSPYSHSLLICSFYLSINLSESTSLIVTYARSPRPHPRIHLHSCQYPHANPPPHPPNPRTHAPTLTLTRTLKEGPLFILQLYRPHIFDCLPSDVDVYQLHTHAGTRPRRRASSRVRCAPQATPITIAMHSVDASVALQDSLLLRALLACARHIHARREHRTRTVTLQLRVWSVPSAALLRQAPLRSAPIWRVLRAPLITTARPPRRA